METTQQLTQEQIQGFRDDGYLLVERLFEPAEIRSLVDNFMEMHAGGTIPGCFEPASPEEADGDIFKLYPRMMHPHRVNELALRYLLDSRLEAVLTGLFEEEPLAAQSMLYFKPAGAKGQALHQDNFYLKVEPGTCIAAWMALDAADQENGGLEVVPGTHDMELFCPRRRIPTSPSPATTCRCQKVSRPCQSSCSLETCSTSTGAGARLAAE